MLKVLTDIKEKIDVYEWSLSSEQVEHVGRPPWWRMVKRRLLTGREDGVDVIEIDSGAMQFTVVPTRGLSLWNGQAGNLKLGWDSPIKEIVHPRFVDLSRRGGLGWLDGFGGWFVRCGLASIGPPCQDRDESLTLHGLIDYLPAKYVEVRYESSPVPRLVVRGTIEEDHPPDVRLRLDTEISIEVGTASILVDDVVTNIGDATGEMQMLYHINFGPPLLGEGAELIAPIKRVGPRDRRAAEESSDRWIRFGTTQGSGYTEQVYLMELQSDAHGETAAMLRASDSASAVALSFNVAELPCFTLWKNEAFTNPGYVTGLEPATSYPYPRPFERQSGRVSSLNPGESRRMRVRIDVLSSPESVESAEVVIRRMTSATPIVVPPLFAND